MKKIAACLGCNKLVSRALTYHAEVERLTKNPITGEWKKQVLIGALCPVCNKLCGYATSRKKLEKFAGVKAIKTKEAKPKKDKEKDISFEDIPF